MFVKVKTKSIVSYIVDVMFLNVLEYKDHLWHHIVYVWEKNELSYVLFWELWIFSFT